MRLIQSCSNPLTSKISNPAISSTPMKVFVDGLPRALLILVTMDPKFFSYSDLASAANSSTTCFVVRAWTTHSLPALTLGRTRALRRSEALVMPRRNATFSSCDWSLMNAWSERSPPTTMLPRLRMADKTRKRSSCSSVVNPTVSRASWESNRSVSSSGYCSDRTHLHQSPLELVVHPSDLALGVLQVLVVGSVARQQ